MAVENYQYGNIQWQQSTDNENWENIEGAIFLTYTCFPENSTYYRAWISYQTCPPDSSQVSYLQRKMQANAGTDKVLNKGFPTLLFGNEYDGTFGQWAVLSGDSAYIEDLNAGNTIFYGTDSLYLLCWTLTDACGTSSDTITIEYITNVYNDRIVIVDTTDLIVSDSTELADGIYRIVFNDPVPTISYATILLGLSDGGFLRKVVSVFYMGDTCCMNTTYASPAEVLVEGTLHIDDFPSMVHTRGSDLPNTVVLDHCPTRAEILSDSLFRSNKMIYYPMSEQIESDFQIEHERDAGWHITFPLITNPIDLSIGGNVRITDLFFNCTPHWEFELLSKLNEPLSLHFGSYNGNLDAAVKLQVNALDINIPLVKETPWFVNKNFVVWAGMVPIVFSLKFALQVESSVKISFSTPFGANLYQHTHYDARVSIDNWVPHKSFYARGELDGNFIINNGVWGDGSVDLSFFLGGDISFSVYGAISAYLTIGPKADLSICTNHEDGHFGSRRGVSVCGQAKFGIRSGDLLQYMHLDIGDYNFSFEFLKKDLRQPNRIGYLSGNNQLFTGSFSALPQPIRIKSYTYFNNPSTNNIVYFEPENGGMVNCAENRVATNEEGIAEVVWSPASPESKLRVSAYDCENHHLEGSPIVISTTGDECIYSTLTAQAYIDEHFVDVMVSGGVPPYQYSTDGLTYEEYFTRFVPEIGTEYTFYVKDAQNCVTTATYCRPNPYNEIIRLDNNYSVPLIRSYIIDSASDDENLSESERVLVFEGPSGGIFLYFGQCTSFQVLPTGDYSGTFCGDNGNPGLFHFCVDWSFAFDSYLDDENDEGRDIVTGEMFYSQANNKDVFTFTYTDEYGHVYIGAFTGILEHEVWTLREHTEKISKTIKSK